MLKTETLEINGKTFIRTYSSLDYKVRQLDTMIEYDEAIDLEGTEHTYQETRTKIEGAV